MADSEPGVSVVVGATGAVGRALVEKLLADGRRVVAVSRDASSWSGREGVIGCAADMATDAAIGLIRTTVDAAVDLVVFAPGLSAPGSWSEVDLAALSGGFDLKVGGLIRLLRALDERLVSGSRVVAVAGSLGVEPGPLSAAPGTINAALLNLMRQVSLALGPRGIVTATVASGPLDTPRLRALAERQAGERGVSVEHVLDEYVAHTSSGRLPRADDVAALIHDLLRPHARALHGSVLSPDGGVRRGVL